MRKAGILLAVASLPGRHGIGDFGENCFHFIDQLSKSKVKLWQILPLNPLGFGNSPYQPYSSKAMDDIYINLDYLYEEGLLKKRPKSFNAKKTTIDYEAVRAFKQPYFLEAFHNFKPNKAYQEFKAQEWVKNYAVFITLKQNNENRMWLEWPQDQQNWIHDHSFDLSGFEEQIDFACFLQFMLVKQWMKIKKYANKKGIQMVGDLPIYVGIDSVDVWASQDSFLLDDKSHPTFIAGVPPDYFSETGQRWGNPLYDWDYLEKHDFSFWVDRLSYNAQLFDFIRIDHFRAFDTYWKIPVSCPTAIEGEWIEAPGYALFDCLNEKIPSLNIIAEDLGDLRPEVLELRDAYHLPGMKVLQFTFDPIHPYGNDPANMISYTGTHDNQTLRSWFKDQSSSYKRLSKKFLKEQGYVYETVNQNFIAYLMDGNENMCVISMQDVLNLTDKARLNVPGTIGTPNWEWKMKDFEDFENQIPFLKSCIKHSHR